MSEFFLSIVEVISTYLSTKIVISKGEFIKRVFKRDLLEFFTTIIPYFSHTYLSFPLINPSYRRVVMRVVEVIKVFRSPKFSSLYFEEADLRFHIVSDSSENSVQRCGLE